MINVAKPVNMLFMSNKVAEIGKNALIFLFPNISKKSISNPVLKKGIVCLTIK